MKRFIIGALLLAMSAGFTFTASAQESASCEGFPTPEIGESIHSFTYDDTERFYMVYVPESYDASAPSPLVLSIHGFASSATRNRDNSQWNPVADEHGFLLVYPQGIGFPARWNTGNQRFNDIGGTGADDVSFFDALLDRLESEYCLDSSRVYVSGLSNGGGMTDRLACELSERFAAAGTVSGAYNLLPDGCPITHPMPLISFHGTADTIVPYEGASGMEMLGYQAWGQAWAERNECDLENSEMLEPVGSVMGTRYSQCAGDVEVVLYTVEDGGHNYPGGTMPMGNLIGGNINQDVVATELMWEFFSDYTLP